MAGSEPESVEQLKERIKELERENRRWMRLAGTSRLTELPNSLMLYQVVLPAELRKGIGTPITLSCVLLAPDSLGDINDSHGRAMGDQLIVEIGNFLKQQLTPDERLFHPDGANFCLLLSGAAEGRARRRTTDIRRLFRESTYKAGEREFSDLTCSAGIASIEEEAVDAPDIAKRVEQLYLEVSDRLHRAKQRGPDYQMGSARREV